MNISRTNSTNQSCSSFRRNPCECYCRLPICDLPFIIRKLDADTMNVLAGAEFQLQNIVTGETQTAVSDSLGRVCFFLTPCITYSLTELVPPAGYESNAQIYTVFADRFGNIFVDDQAARCFTICNTPISGPTLYTVTYDANGGVGSFVDSDIPAGAVYMVKTAGETGISRTGYLFAGWNTAPAGSGTLYLPEDTFFVESNMTLYAMWEQVVPEVYNITYSPNGGTGGFVDAYIPQGSLYTVKTAAEEEVLYDGYEFSGWNTAPDGSGISYQPGDTITVVSSLVLYAQWQAIE